MRLQSSTAKRSTDCLRKISEMSVFVLILIDLFVSNQDGEGSEEDTNFDPGYEPDWAVISTVKKDREHAPVKDSGSTSCFLQS